MHVEEALSALRTATSRLTPWLEEKDPREDGTAHQTPSTQIVAELLALTATSGREMAELFARQREALSHLNLALFGRTGTGKSTLLEVFQEGDGAAVSPGESDWTTGVTPAFWAGCRIFDTPGINGWGRTCSRIDLEEAARRAAEVADLVILLFDTSNQLASEFEKIGEWIQAYGKPVIAILNAKMTLWRLPAEVQGARERETLSRTVAEHAGNIRDELAKIGLANVPVIAMHGQRALFGRGRAPHLGPFPMMFERQRARFGKDKLLRWSNFDALEDLLVAALEEDALGLRLGMLRDQVRGALARTTSVVAEKDIEARAAGYQLERLIEGVLRVVGYPSQAERDALRDRRVSRDLLSEFESLRGAQFHAPAQGMLADYADHLLSARFGALRMKALGAAEEVVLAAFDKREVLDQEKFMAHVFNQPAIEGAVGDVMKESEAYLCRKLRVQAGEFQTDVHCLLGGIGTADGGAGSRWRHVGTASRMAQVLTSALAVAMPFLLSNPIGWVAALAIGVTAAVFGGLFGWFGKKAREKAERERLAARVGALSAARHFVHQEFEKIQVDARQQIATLGSRVAGAQLEEALRAAIVCNVLAREMTWIQGRLAAVVGAVPAGRSPTAIVAHAMTAAEQRRFPDDPGGARKLWLGEDWLTDPEGLRPHEDARESPRPRAASWKRTSEQFGALFDSVAGDVRPNSGVEWLESAERELRDDARAQSALAALRALVIEDKPRLLLCGDYSAGKSSFIKRLLVDDGMTPPSRLEVRAEPTTTRVAAYDWQGMLLVDTPGFQSGQAAHLNETLAAIPDASAVLYLLQPNLISGHAEALDAVLLGDAKAGLVGKLPRTFFIVNRVDAMGADPMDAPEEFERLCAGKRSELLASLRSRGLAVDPAQIFFMASDPFGLVGGRSDVTSASYDSCRDWDGFRPFLAAFGAHRMSLARSGVDVSVLEGGIGRFTQISRSIHQEAKVIRERAAALASVSALAAEARGEVEDLTADVHNRLTRRVEEFTIQLLDDALNAEREEAIRVHAERLNEWWNEEAFCDLVALWQEETVKAIEAWRLKADDALQRRISSREFKQAFPDIGGTRFDPDSLLKKKRGNKAGKAAGKAGKAMGGATRDAVYRFVKAMGGKFSPWGAVKLAAKLRVAGAVLGGVAVVLDIRSWWKDARAEKGREQARAAVAHHLIAQRASIVEAIALGAPGEVGPVKLAKQYTDEMAELQQTVGGEIRELEVELLMLEDLDGQYLRQIQAARSRIGHVSPAEEQRRQGEGT